MSKCYEIEMFDIEVVGGLDDDLTPEQNTAYDYLMMNEDEVFNIILHALLKTYPQFTSAEKLIKNINPVMLIVHDKFKDGTAYVGFEFAADFDKANGVGILMLNDKIIKIGNAKVAKETP